ncbi:MAG: hypothetical protein GW779_00130 [Candidatus Altiarchaeum hamiconexum]|uniref:LamG-like jellyroll fold domain-containing protein n=1 Tax=Candidatus Altarchaeum hamiconexum TaxID=1803513 RepID=A0A8J7YRJ5_9ARCH|nr:hypothetical protein [Candidatus Altarchaeum hamiconexum]PIN67421.1 MAG: hypothetical protein COV98_02915 [Candidatus Altarchaeum sp. CG12_big_fil_rev_8_21_14_0_65_33_22]PIV28086.1 MAG: hypothetical protein COS36_03405 [Candidatus Altarchaeum sp. CG03_land_8_20_14_0_80_32_618]PIX49531.1 MAG: hypothetical protein COZ53_00360 [Candidatus Altarchaeum sp. CG_4_8_14_3_um_filter_33_2054]PIZ30020.1 MAG: hypothetical protein COY41_04725 [Candidatus Altarchaeum sp. CG_4_10_14_0_8_um_filter_32_851]PJ
MQFKIKNLRHYAIVLLIFICFFCSVSLVNADKFNNEPGLAAYYPFEEGEGNETIDMSGNCNNGIIYGAKWADGIYDKGLKFNGHGEHVTIPYKEILNISKKITIEAWIKKEPTNYLGTVVASNIDYVYVFGVLPDGRLGFFIGVPEPGNGWNVVCVGGTVGNGWNHITGTYDYSTGNAKIYLNGNSVASCKGMANSTKNPGGFSIGYEPHSTEYHFNGTIDEIKIYNIVLTETEIKKEYEYKSIYNTLKPVNSHCSKNSDCKTNNCFNGICKGLGYCENHSDCYSCHYCDVNNSRCKPLKEIGFQCKNDSECKTKICAEGICAGKRDKILKKPKISHPGSNGKAQGHTDNIKIDKSKGGCNFDFDCLPAKYCDKDNKCKNLKDENFACSRDAECKTNNCYYEVCKNEGYVAVWSFIIGTFMLIFTILIFFLPGFALTLIKKEISLFERICAGIGLGLALNILGMFVLNKFGYPINLLFIALYALSFVWFGTLFYYLKNEHALNLKFKNFRPKERIKRTVNNIKNNKIRTLNFSILLLALLFTFFLQYGIHSDYDYPFHTDEWQHLARAVQIIDTQTIPDVDPYYNKYPIGEMDLEIGFHVFLAEFYILSNQDPVLFYKFFPAIFSMLAGLMLFLLVKKITKNFYAGILSILFFASLKSTIGILGVWFFVPLSMDFMFIFLFFYLYVEGMRRNSAIFLFFSTIVISTIALIHPQSASWIYPVIIAYLLLFAVRNLLKINLTNILKFKNAIFGNVLLFSLPFLSFIYFFKILWNGDFGTTLYYFLKEFIVFRGCPAERGICEPNFIPDFYGTVAFILAIVGLAYLIYKFIKNKGEDKFNSLLLTAWIFGMVFLISTLYVEPVGKAVASLMGIQYSPFTLLAGSIRLFYETFLCLAALSGIGLYVIIKFIYVRIKNTNLNQRQKGIAFISVIFITGILIFANVFAGYYDLKVKIYKNIDNDDYKAIKWIEKNFGNYNVIFARSHISETIYPISKNYVVAVTPHANIPTTSERNNYVYSFFMGDCNTKKQILNKYDAYLVIEKYPIKCDFLEEIYNKGVYVYTVEMAY